VEDALRPRLQRAATAAFIASAALASGPAEAEMASGAVLASTCFSCHGPDGKGEGGMPSIAGMSPDFIAQKLKAFKSDEIEATIMNRIAKGFTNEEISALAKFFSSR
jgi:sulfide dehydrogenase cytochrome subunit